MRILDRYVGGTVLASILLVLAIIVGLDAMTAFIDESQKMTENYTFVDVTMYVLLTVPGRIYEYVPFAALIGCLIGLGQLASSSEIVVMRSAGVSVARLVWIVMQPTLFVALSGFLIGEYVAPQTEQIAQSQKTIALSRGEGIQGSRGLWNREGNTYMSFNTVEANGVVHGINLLQFNDSREIQSALRAERAVYQGEHWILEEVVETHFTSWETTQSQHATQRWETGITPDLLTMVVVAPEYLPAKDLYRYSRYLFQQGLNSDDYRLALWNKLLQPIAIAGLVLVAISFIFGPLRDGTMGFRIFAGVIIGIIFRTLQDLLGPASLVFGFSPIYAALFPILICVVAGALMLRKAR
jgi:lipopolysaccharide export system permease protein